MNLIKDRIVRRLESESCPVHGQHPKVSWSGDSIKAECCCDAFRTRIGEMAADLFANEVAESLVSRLR